MGLGLTTFVREVWDEKSLPAWFRCFYLVAMGYAAAVVIAFVVALIVSAIA